MHFILKLQKSLYPAFKVSCGRFLVGSVWITYSVLFFCFGSFITFIVDISLFTHADSQAVDISFAVFIVCL